MNKTKLLLLILAILGLLGGLFGEILFGGVTQAQPANEAAARPAGEPDERVEIRMIGLDTSHSVKFTEALNDTTALAFAGYRVVAAYPKGSLTIKSSYSRIPKYTQKVKKMGVEIVGSIDELLEKVDVVLLETNDGRCHLEQVLSVLKAGKPVFVDKPLADSLSGAVAIFEAARRYDVPIFSSSSLRYMQSAQAIRDGEMGRVVGASTYVRPRLKRRIQTPSGTVFTASRRSLPS
jgi:predicted dehydrogenase